MTVANRVSVAQSLEDVIKHCIKPLLRWQHQSRDVITGLIGERGEGKSIGAALIAFRDYMIQGEPCWSNMKIKCTVRISDEDAAQFGLEGGEVVYEAEELDIPALLRLEDRFEGGCIVTDEINMELAEARRSQCNVNLYCDRAGQQLRKMKSAWIYTVIHEMWVDNRIRDSLTDIFIKCKDTANDPEGLLKKKTPGVNFEWQLFPWSRKLCGISYRDMKESFPPLHLNLKKMWGVIDTYEKQAEGKTKYSMDFSRESSMTMEIQKGLTVQKHKEDWDWLWEELINIAKDLNSRGENYIISEELWERLSLRERRISPKQMGRKLAEMGIKAKAVKRGGYNYYAYELPSYNLEEAFSVGAD